MIVLLHEEEPDVFYVLQRTLSVEDIVENVQLAFTLQMSLLHFVIRADSVVSCIIFC